MPEISRFYGLVIFMNYRDHLPPHFHVWYGENKAIVDISTGKVTGLIPVRAKRMVLEWLKINKNELLQDWDLTIKGEPLKKINPLL